LGWLESAFDYILVQVVVCAQVFCAGAIAHGRGKDGITFVVIQDKYAFVAATRPCGKFTGLVGSDLACGVEYHCKNVVGALVGSL
jgi:hypothetical protein